MTSDAMVPSHKIIMSVFEFFEFSYGVFNFYGKNTRYSQKETCVYVSYF